MDIQIRNCEISDLNEILEIQTEVIGNFKESEKGYFLPFSKEEIDKILNNPKTEGKISGAFVDKKMVAWVNLSIALAVEDLLKHLPNISGKSADVDGVMVLPEYRGNGIQNKLLTHIEEVAKEYEIKNLLMDITYGNDVSLNNVQKLGYVVNGQYNKSESIKRQLLVKNINVREI